MSEGLRWNDRAAATVAQWVQERLQEDLERLQALAEPAPEESEDQAAIDRSRSRLKAMRGHA